MQLHEAAGSVLVACLYFAVSAMQVSEDDAIDGYRHIWRVEETWQMLKRQQNFGNWFTKKLPACKDNSSCSLARS